MFAVPYPSIIRTVLVIPFPCHMYRQGMTGRLHARSSYGVHLQGRLEVGTVYQDTSVLVHTACWLGTCVLMLVYRQSWNRKLREVPGLENKPVIRHIPDEITPFDPFDPFDGANNP